jgi:lipid-A-disaccharide synthase
LSNILLGREIVPELLQDDCNAQNIENYVESFIARKDIYTRQMAGFSKVREVLGFGEQTPSQKAAETIMGVINNKK